MTWQNKVVISLIGCNVLLFTTVHAQDSSEEPLLRLFTTPAEREQIEAALFAPPPPPPEETGADALEEVRLPPEIHYQGLILRTNQRPLLLINDILVENNLYGNGFVVKTEQLQGYQVPITVEGFGQQFMLAPGQRINTSGTGKIVLDSYEATSASDELERAMN